MSSPRQRRREPPGGWEPPGGRVRLSCWLAASNYPPSAAFALVGLVGVIGTICEASAMAW